MHDHFTMTLNVGSVMRKEKQTWHFLLFPQYFLRPCQLGSLGHCVRVNSFTTVDDTLSFH